MTKSSCARVLSAAVLACASFLLLECGGSTGDNGGGGTPDASSDGGCGPLPGAWDCVNPCTHQMHGPVCKNGAWTCDDPTPEQCGDAGADAGCGPPPGGWDCVNPCTQQMHLPVCKDGNWTCDDPSPEQCGDGDAGCAAIGNLVPVSCTPFPENTTCDPFGTWLLSYDTSFPGQCAASSIGQLVIERGTDGIARVGFGSTSWATLSSDGCQLSVESKLDWTNPSEYGTVEHTLTLVFDAGSSSASGQLVYEETGFCAGSGTTNASAQKQSI